MFIVCMKQAMLAAMQRRCFSVQLSVELLSEFLVVMELSGPSLQSQEPARRWNLFLVTFTQLTSSNSAPKVQH
jgi:hypothetical protein